MTPELATLVYTLGILGLFRLDRDRNSRPSHALWLPVAWLTIGASRGVSEWLGGVSVMRSPDQYLDGSPLDQMILSALLVAGLIVLFGRERQVASLLRANGPLLLFFGYCAVSAIWSEYPFVALKRWTKVLGNLVMVLIVLTERDPIAAFKRLLTRSGFLLVSLSVLLIKYYPELGRGFSEWTGEAVNSGVAVGKNGLGFICLIFGLATLWRVLEVFRRDRPPPYMGPVIANGVVLAMALWLFRLADSAASFASFVASAALMTLACVRGVALRPLTVHTIVLSTLAVSLYALFVESDAGLVQALGRDATLTGRVELWQDVLNMPINPLVGAGFESFWLGDRARWLWEKHWWHPNQAHNGYLEVYLNSGWIGLSLLGVVLVWGYRNAVRALRLQPELGGLRLALVVATLLQNLTEATFKVIHPVWIAFLLAVVVVPRARTGAALTQSSRPHAAALKSPPVIHTEVVR